MSELIGSYENNYKKGVNMRTSWNNKNKSIKSNKREWFETVAIMMMVIFIKIFVFEITYVSGQSMSPTIEGGDSLLLKKYESILNIEEYNRGDIVVFESPVEKEEKPFSKKMFVKRVIGLPGDRINISGGKVFVNSEPINEVYIENNSFTDSLYYGDNYIVPEGEIFVIGDNRSPGGSNDSRSFASISLESIKGKAVFRIFPFDKIGSLKLMNY